MRLTPDGQPFVLRGVQPANYKFFRLPDHIEVLPGSYLTLEGESSPILLPDTSTLTIFLNGQPVTSVRLNATTSPSGTRISARVPLTGALLHSGWNRIDYTGLLVSTLVPCRDVDNQGCWVKLSPATGLTVAYRLAPSTFEAADLPGGMANDLLFFQNVRDKEMPGAIWFLTGDHPSRSDATLTGIATVAARLGQDSPFRLAAARVGRLSEWGRVAGRANGFLFGTAGELAALDLPVDVRAALQALAPGDGLVTSFPAGAADRPRRWAVVAGADESGLAKAAAAIGSSAALISAPPGPLIVREMPTVPAWAERVAQPPSMPRRLRELGMDTFALRGTFLSLKTIPLRIPPGYMTDSGGKIDMRFVYSGGLTTSSAMELRLNALSCGGFTFRSDRTQDHASVEIPKGLGGGDPGALDFRAYLDVGAVDCAHRNEERAWVQISGDSTVDLRFVRRPVHSLADLPILPLGDALLRETAFLVSDGSGDTGLLSVIGLSAWTGQQLPSSPILWPAAAWYGTDRRPAESATRDRGVIVLGPVSTWTKALARGHKPFIQASDDKAAVIQGEKLPASSLDPSTTFVEWLGKGVPGARYAVAAGGISGIDAATLTRAFTDSEWYNQIWGDAAAVDKQGRFAIYDFHSPSHRSFAQEISRRLSGAAQGDEDDSNWVFKVVAVLTIVLLLMVIAVQGWLIYDRRQRRRQEEKKEREQDDDPDELPPAS